MINLMNRNRKNPYFWLVFVVVTVVIFLVAAKSFSNYTSRIDVLLLPKNEKTANNITLIKNNLEYLFSKQEIKLSGDQNIKISSDSKNTIITFKTYSDTKKSLGSLNKKAVTEFFNVSSKHYNVKKDLEMRIVGKISTKMYLGSIWMPVVIAVSLGFIISNLVFGLVYLIEKTSGRFSSNLVGGEKRFSQINLDKFKKNIDGQKKSSKSRDEVEVSLKESRRNGKRVASSVEEIYKKHDKNDESVVTGFKKSHPPMNLPTTKESDSKKESFDKTQDRSTDKAQDKEKEEKKKDEIDWENRLQELKGKSAGVKDAKKEKKEVSVSATAGGPVPSNLPIGDDGVFEITASDVKKESFDKTQDRSIDKTQDREDIRKGEPTKDEYRKRLNQLLKGDI
ncbi:hypothetical protein ACFL2R_00685 [Patescibacteria group bacterium]